VAASVLAVCVLAGAWLSTRPSSAERDFNKGVAALKDGNADEAKRLFKQVSDASSKSTPALQYAWGHAHLAKGEWAEALDFFEQAEVTWRDGRALAAKAYCLALLTKTQESRAVYDAAVREGYTNAIVYNNRGVVREMCGDRDGARADYSEAIRLDGGLVEAYLNRARVTMHGNPTPEKVAAAKGDLDTALILREPSAAMLYEAARLALRAGNTEEALERLSLAATKGLPSNIITGDPLLKTGLKQHADRLAEIARIAPKQGTLRSYDKIVAPPLDLP
jgi:tetratricopeptide (TPR) repeat protein